MTIVVLAADNMWEALTNNSADIEWIKATDDFSFKNYKEADAFFILTDTTDFNFTETVKPVFINSVTTTLNELNTADNILRINGWDTFLQRSVWEIAGKINDSNKAIAEKLNKKIFLVNDEPGFVSAKIIAMIINEAYFALGDEVSSKTEIDTAMKLGTNYPYGPFEWAEKIGVKNIYDLLKKLSVTDKRYQPAPTLIAEAAKK
ncbi:3-hydroxyacyl-CoA dehydrogenase family protein [Ferruginibacter sp.]